VTYSFRLRFEQSDMRTVFTWVIALSLSATACHSATAPRADTRSGNGTPPGTALDLLVVRGPVTPVCQIDEPCDAPFSAQFLVQQNGREVTQFTTDSAGHALVSLAAGAYTVVPGPNTPIIAPQSQRRAVTVRPEGITMDTLRFDTGIR